MSHNLKRVAKFVADSNGAFSEGQLRWWIFQAAENGLNDAGAIVRIGRTVFLDVDAFDGWLSAHSSSSKQQVAA